MRMPRRPKKRCAKRGRNASTDPLVNPGDTAHCEPHGPASDPGNSNHRLVNLEKNPSSCGQDRAYAPKNATVMLETVECARLESSKSKDGAHSPYARYSTATLMSAMRAATAASKNGIECPVRAESIMRRATLPIVGVGFTVGGAVRCWRHVLI